MTAMSCIDDSSICVGEIANSGLVGGQQTGVTPQLLELGEQLRAIAIKQRPEPSDQSATHAAQCGLNRRDQ